MVMIPYPEWKMMVIQSFPRSTVTSNANSSIAAKTETMITNIEMMSHHRRRSL